MEKGFAYKTFSEGMANWASLEALLIEIANVDNPARSLEFHQTVLTDDKTLTTTSTEERIKELVRRGSAKLFRLLDPSTFKEELKVSETELFDDPALGYYFVNEAVYRLRESKLTRAQAMVFLIQHPPTTIDELTHPAKYAGELLSIP